MKIYLVYFCESFNDDEYFYSSCPGCMDGSLIGAFVSLEEGIELIRKNEQLIRSGKKNKDVEEFWHEIYEIQTESSIKIREYKNDYYAIYLNGVYMYANNYGKQDFENNLYKLVYTSDNKS